MDFINELRSVTGLLRGSSESIVDQKQIAAIAIYLMLSAAFAAPIALPGSSLWLRLACAVVLLVAFLMMTRVTVRWLQTLDEFGQLIAYRALATAGFIAVWFVLFTGAVFLLVGFDNLFVVMALGPPEFWLCAALFMRGAERAYATPDSA